MRPFQFSSSSSSSSSTLCSTGLPIYPFGTDNSTLAPPPDLLNFGSSEALGSNLPIQLDLLPAGGLSELLQQPHFVQWLSQMTSLTQALSLSSSSSSSSTPGSRGSSDGRLTGKTRKFESTTGKQRDESELTPDPKRVRSQAGRPKLLSRDGPPVTARLPLKEAAQCIRDSILFKTRQQLRDDEFNRVMDGVLPAVLIAMTREYIGSELSLSQLELDEYNVPVPSGSQAPVLKNIVEDYSASYPGSVLFQNEIAQAHHRITLDTLFTGKGSAENCAASVYKDNHPGAREARRKEIAAVINYLPHPKCEQLLDAEISAIPGHGRNSGPYNLRLSINNELLLGTVQKKCHSPESEAIRMQTLELKRAKLILGQAKAQLKVNHDNACRLFLQALQLLCRLNRKREVIELVIQLIDVGSKKSGFNLDEMVNLFSITKALCLKYPFDHDLYVRLVYAMDEPCRLRSRCDLSKQFYQEADMVPLLLRQGNKAQFLYRRIQADLRSGDSTLFVLNRINSAVEYCLHVIRCTYIESPSNDMSRAEFVYSCALLFQLAGKAADQYFELYEQWSEPQRAACLSIIKNQSNFYDRLDTLRELYFSLLPQGTPSNPPPRAQLLSASAEYYKFALIFLLVDLSRAQDQENQKLLISLFDGLVGFYTKHQNTAGLDSLLNNKTVQHFTAVPGISSAVKNWRKVLREMKKQY